jgi:hypothetical protein
MIWQKIQILGEYMKNLPFEIITSDDCRETYVTNNRETEKHLTCISRSGTPQGMSLDLLASPTPLAASQEDLPEESGASPKRRDNRSPEEKKKWIEEKIRENVDFVRNHPAEIHHINVSVYKQKLSSPDRLTINIDMVLHAGAKFPFKLSADCVSKSRKRELKINVTDKDWWGYDYALEQLDANPDRTCFAGKLKNRNQHKTWVARKIIPHTAIVIRPVGAKFIVEIIIGDQTFEIEMAEEQNSKALKYFDMRGSYQRITEEEW